MKENIFFIAWIVRTINRWTSRPFLAAAVFFATGLCLSELQAQTQAYLREKISVQVLSTGSLNNRFSFDGPLGDELVATPEKTPEECEVRGRFVRARMNKKNQLDLRLKIECDEKGRKKSYRPPRLYLDPALDRQRKKIGYLSDERSSIDLVFEGLSLSKSK